MQTEYLLPIGLGVILLLLFCYGIWEGFGPPSKHLTDPFDEHDD